MIKKALFLFGLCLSGMVSASDLEAQLKNSVRNFQNLVEKIEETGKIDSNLSKIRSSFDHDIRKKSDNALFDKPLNQEEYRSYCRQIHALNEQLDLLAIQQKNV